MNLLYPVKTKTTPKIIVMIDDRKWLSRLESILDRNVDDPHFDNFQLAQELEISERNLFRKVKSNTGMTPQKFLNHYRMRQAMLSMQNGKYKTVKETAYSVGYRNVSYFIRQFTKTFGKKPLSVLKEAGWR